MGYDSFGYNLVYLCHILAVVVGFGSSFVWPALAAKGRKMEPASGYAMSSAIQQVAKPLTTYSIYAAGAFGILLVILSDELFKFSQAWISIAFLLFIAGVLVAAFLHTPNLVAMNALQAKLVAGDVTPSAGGPPAEVAELGDRGKKAGMYGGILHLIFLLMMIDMIWKPGF